MKATAVVAMLCALGALPAAAQAPAGDAARGKAVFMKQLCHTCHGTAGQGGDRGSGPKIAPDVFPWEGYVQAIRRPRSVMPRYSKEQMSDQELADTYAYLTSIKPGRKAGDISFLKD